MPVSSREKLGSLASVLDLVDDRFGPVKSIYGIKTTGKQPPFWVFHAQLTRPLGQYFVDYDCDAWGSSVDKDEALFKCLGEVLERYCMYNTFLTGEFAQLPASECQLLRQFPRCAPDERCADSYKEISPDWTLTMASVKEVATGNAHWIPAGYVDFSYQSPEGEPRVTLSHSSGSAFHENLHRAIWAGLCEVAERDAFSLFWLNQYCAKEITFDLNFGSDTAELNSLAKRLKLIKDSGLRVRSFDITTDFRVPTVFSVVQGDEFPFATFGASCSADPVKAVIKSIDEVFLVRLAQLSGEKEVLDAPSYTDFSWVNQLRDHCDLYARWQDTPAFDFFMKKSETISLSELRQMSWWSEPDSYEQLRDTCAMLQERLGMTVLFMDCTLDDVSKFGVGIKVVVPQMQPISVPESLKWLAHLRLAQHAERLSLKCASNPYPHPFP
jgi:ribosomal protein S12 methylthiotransferase accessory factor